MRKAIVVVLAAAIAVPALAQEAKEAAALYRARCAACHGPSGQPTATGKKMGAQDLTSTKLTAERAKEIITNGDKKMPAYKSKLSPEQIQDLATYVAGGLR